MVPSTRRSVLVCALALIGLGLWQAYRASADNVPEKQRTMTVYDDGQELRCRIVKITLRDNGLRVYDLEVIDTGEKVTVEELPPLPNVGRDRKTQPLRTPEATSKPGENKTASGIVQTGHGQRPQPQDQDTLVEADAPSQNKHRKRLPERLANRVTSLFPEKKKADQSGEAELPPTKTEASKSSEARTAEQPSANSKTPVANLISQVLPSGRPNHKEQPGTVPANVTQTPVATATRVVEPAPELPRGARAVVQEFTGPDNQTSNKGLIPRLTGKSTYQPEPVVPKNSMVTGYRPPTSPQSGVQERTTLAAQSQYKITERRPATSSNAKEAHPVGVAQQPVVNSGVAPAPDLPPAIGDWTLELAARPPLPPPLPATEFKQPVASAKASGSVIFGPSPLASMAAVSAAPPKPPATQASVKRSHPDTVPAGSGSVLAAKSGARAPVTFVPVPIVTVPDPLRRPGPPEPKIPDPPQANAYLNAFTPTPQPHAQRTMAMVPANGAYTNPYLMQPGMVPMHPAYSQIPMQPIQGASMVNPYAAQRPVAQVNYPMHYQGPMPPNPMMQAAPAYYGQPMPMYPAMRMPAPTVPAAMAAPAPNVEQLASMLRDSPYPSQREWAAHTLAGCDVRSNPQIVVALSEAARKDPAGSVRAGCVHCLARMTVPANEVLGTFASMREDSDPRVREEVTQALARMGHTVPERQAIQPVSQLP